MSCPRRPKKRFKPGPKARMALLIAAYDPIERERVWAIEKRDKGLKRACYKDSPEWRRYCRETDLRVRELFIRELFTRIYGGFVSSIARTPSGLSAELRQARIDGIYAFGRSGGKTPILGGVGSSALPGKTITEPLVVTDEFYNTYGF